MDKLDEVMDTVASVDDDIYPSCCVITVCTQSTPTVAVVVSKQQLQLHAVHTALILVSGGNRSNKSLLKLITDTPDIEVGYCLYYMAKLMT